MTDAERIDLVEAYDLDVWKLEPWHGASDYKPLGWVVDTGEPDRTLWDGSPISDGGTSLVVGAASWRDAVDKAAELLGVLRGPV